MLYTYVNRYRNDQQADIFFKNYWTWKKRILGYLGEDPSHYEREKILDYLILIATLYAGSNGVTPSILKESKREPGVLYPAKLTKV